MRAPHRIVLSLLLAAAISGIAIIAGCGDNPVSPEHSSLELQVHELINQHRLSKGLPALTLNATISAQARDHSFKMANGSRAFGHDFFDDRKAAINQTIPLERASENVAFNLGAADPAATAVEGWLNSPEHLANIEGGFDLTGIGIVQDNSGRFLFTQIFVKKK
jgi:uncharacterized protein YkwD